MKTIKGGRTHIPLFMLGLFLIITSSACVAGYFFERPYLCCWRGEIGMALNTATCFVAVGIALIIISLWRKQTEDLAHELQRLKENKT